MKKNWDMGIIARRHVYHPRRQRPEKNNKSPHKNLELRVQECSDAINSDEVGIDQAKRKDRVYNTVMVFGCGFKLYSIR